MIISVLSIITTFAWVSCAQPHSNSLEESLLNAEELNTNEGFAVYLTKYDIPPEQMEMLSHVERADNPVVSEIDIVTYDAQTHEILLTDDAFKRISRLDVPVRGKSFLVCIDKSAVYWGAFWTPVSSVSFDGIVIWKPFGTEESKSIQIQLGYPGSTFYNAEDPRSNTIIIQSLENADKLINRLSLQKADGFPHSFKGYELYSWEEKGQWHFTLITGTNRTKTIEEITSKEDIVSTAGFYKAHVTGENAIKNVLSRLPENEPVFWCGQMHISDIAEVNFLLPPQPILESIIEHAEFCKLDFSVPKYE